MQNRITFHATILLYPSNLVSLFRLELILKTWLLLFLIPLPQQNLLFRAIIILLLSASALLDLLDGHLARKFDQATEFGALLDQIIDLLIHTTLWTLSGFALAVPILLLEWSVGILVAYTALYHQGHWKAAMTTAQNGFVYKFARRYFSNNQRNRLSISANLSHIGFPAALYLGSGFEWGAYLAVPGVILYEVATIVMLRVLIMKRAA